MPVDPEGELISRVAKIDNFLQSVLSDDLDDWILAKDFGEILVRLDPEEALGHAVLARAYRHLGDRGRASAEVNHCRSSIMQPAEAEVLGLLLAEEERLLSER